MVSVASWPSTCRLQREGQGQHRGVGAPGRRRRDRPQSRPPPGRRARGSALLCLCLSFLSAWHRVRVLAGGRRGAGGSMHTRRRFLPVPGNRWHSATHLRGGTAICRWCGFAKLWQRGGRGRIPSIAPCELGVPCNAPPPPQQQRALAQGLLPAPPILPWLYPSRCLWPCCNGSLCVWDAPRCCRRERRQ